MGDFENKAVVTKWIRPFIFGSFSITTFG